MALAALATAWYVDRNKERFGGGEGYAIDPVCGMQLDINPTTLHRQKGQTHAWFCGPKCAAAFDAKS